MSSNQLDKGFKLIYPAFAQIVGTLLNNKELSISSNYKDIWDSPLMADNISFKEVLTVLNNLLNLPISRFKNTSNESR